ncbi:MAG: hypothetical protein RLZ25_2052 [Pseudomonadota bacterium]|jgi:universal stress protein A
MIYKTILVAHDFSDSGTKAFHRALALAKEFDAQLHLLHVVEYIVPIDTSFGAISPFDGDLTDQLLDSARKRLQHLGQKHGIVADHCRVELGSPKIEIIRIAEMVKADLIILGCHGRHGLGLLLGSTAASVVNHADCDVLSVRHDPK